MASVRAQKPLKDGGSVVVGRTTLREFCRDDNYEIISCGGSMAPSDATREELDCLTTFLGALTTFLGAPEDEARG